MISTPEPNAAKTRKERIRVMLVDDSSTFRNFLRNVLSEESDLEIVA